MSKIAVCLAAAPAFLLPPGEAIAIAKRQIEVILGQWQSVCDAAGLSDVDRALLWRRQFLNAVAFQDAPDALSALVT